MGVEYGEQRIKKGGKCVGSWDTAQSSANCFGNWSSRIYTRRPGIPGTTYPPGRYAAMGTNQEWRSRGAEFLAEPKDHGAEIRCYMRDPDGYLIEVGQTAAPSAWTGAL